MRNVKPTKTDVRKVLKHWSKMENYVLQEWSLNKLFIETYPKNDNILEVLIKVCALNDFYSTNIFSPFTVAKHIVALNIDARMESKDCSIVNEIAGVKFSD